MKYEKVGKTKKKIKNLKEVIKMKDLKAFLEAMATDKELAEKVGDADGAKEIVEIAKEAGYAVTEEEITDILMEAVSGGKIDAAFWTDLGVTVVETTGAVLSKVGEASGNEKIQIAGGITQVVGKQGRSISSKLFNK